MLFKGFKFGMLLQLAIGPVCIFIFQLAVLNGFIIAEAGVLGVSLIDGLFILSAILGIASILEKEKIQTALKFFGTAILFIFGISICISVFEIKILPSFNLLSMTNINSSFLQAIILTISNPLTIFFWAGVFSTKIIEEDFKKIDLYLFGLGALTSTLFFLTLIAFIGSFTMTFISPVVINYMNFFVGILLIYFSVRMFIKR